ncbi:hypothetical protein [Ferrovibrio sp.]|uniref:hypothetical protein n=1 Tax=Ferrovibrio sp. TaxID=1917215 RepID=UPI001B62924C|nr:hypothetical protein [Ferrovibrio sp.]MBP7063667.1 hypothetical protein [Ferrovibrio sp.]
MNDLDESLGYWVISALLVVLGMLGIVVAANAVDTAMQVFGLVLAGFAVLFCYFSIDRTHSLGKDGH